MKSTPTTSIGFYVTSTPKTSAALGIFNAFVTLIDTLLTSAHPRAICPKAARITALSARVTYSFTHYFTLIRPALPRILKFWNVGGSAAVTVSSARPRLTWLRKVLSTNPIYTLQKHLIAAHLFPPTGPTICRTFWALWVLWGQVPSPITCENRSNAKVESDNLANLHKFHI